MGWYYRKRRGNTTFSWSRYGPRISFGAGGRGGGCLLPLALLAVTALALRRAAGPPRR